MVHLVPGIETEGLRGATFCPRDGLATPEAVVRGYAAAAAEAGVRIRQGVEVKRILVLGNKILGVDTTEGASRRIRSSARPVSGRARSPRSSGSTCRSSATSLDALHARGGQPPRQPAAHDRLFDGFRLPPGGPGLAFGGREPTIEGVASHATRRLPVLNELPIQSSWWGYYEMSPDHNALVGEAHEPTRFLYATGFSGHGFQQCPAVGEHLAERIVRILPTLNLSAFSAERFARGQLREEQFVI